MKNLQKNIDLQKTFNEEIITKYEGLYNAIVLKGDDIYKFKKNYENENNEVLKECYEVLYNTYYFKALNALNNLMLDDIVTFILKNADLKQIEENDGRALNTFITNICNYVNNNNMFIKLYRSNNVIDTLSLCFMNKKTGYSLGIYKMDNYYLNRSVFGGKFDTIAFDLFRNIQQGTLTIENDNTYYLNDIIRHNERNKNIIDMFINCSLSKLEDLYFNDIKIVSCYKYSAQQLFNEYSKKAKENPFEVISLYDLKYKF